MPAAPTISRPPSRTAQVMVRTALTHPFTDPQLLLRVNGQSKLSTMPPAMQRLLSLLDNQPREQGVTVIGVRHACKVLGLNAGELINALDDLNAAKALFFVSFEMPGGGNGIDTGGWSFFACKPFAQHGDVPLKVASKLARQLIREDRA